MSEFISKYQAKKVDANGYVAYTAEENAIWHDLYQRQQTLLVGHVCDEFLQGLEQLQLSAKNMPQLVELSQRLKPATGWDVEPVPALIPHKRFFELLASRRFPAATFIRSREDFNYITEPDMFHEAFGHCPLLCHQIFADFTEKFAKFVLSQPEHEWPLLQRFYWFTVEFGLINTPAGLRCYGGGIISSPEEIVYCIESTIPERKPFDIVSILRTPYRIDILQPVYFVIDDYQQLYRCLEHDFMDYVREAKRLGEFAPKFVVDDTPTIHINYC